jgi:hypothetical protein
MRNLGLIDSQTGQSLLAKMREQAIRDLSDGELDRVFSMKGGIICKRGVMLMLKEGLTLEGVYK